MGRLFKYAVPDSPGWRTRQEFYEFSTPTSEWEDAFENETGISLIDFGNLLLDCSPLITTLAFLGYDVPTVEVERHNRTARAEIRHEAIQYSKSTRPVDALYEPHRIRFYVERVNSPNAPPPVAISERDIDDYMAWFGAWYDIPMADLDAAYRSSHDDGLGMWSDVSGLPEDNSLAAVIERNLKAMIAGGLDGAFTLETGLAAPGTPGGSYRDEMGGGIIQIISDVAIAPVAAFLQYKLGRTADDWYRADAAIATLRPPGALPPGRLAVLDPENWRDGARVIASNLEENEHNKVVKSLQYIKKSYGLILQSMTKEAFTNPHPQGQQGRFVEKPGQHFYMAGLSSHRPEFLHKPLPANTEFPVSAASVLIQRLTEGTFFGADVLVYGNDADREEDENLGLIAMYAKARARADTLTGAPHLRGLLHLARQFDPAQYLRFPEWRGYGTASEAEETLRRLGSTEGTATYVYGQIASEDYLSGVNALMIFGLFSVDHLLGLPGPDADLIEPEYDIIAEEIDAEPGKIRLTLPDYVHQGIVLELTADNLGYTLQQAVTWTYLPTPEKIAHTGLESARQKIGGNNNPKIVLVAAPGVAINRVEWPSTVDMEVIRVQDIGQVPLPDTPINPLLYSAARTVPISEIVTQEHLDADADLAALYDDLGEDAKHFKVVIKPMNVPASIPDGLGGAAVTTGLSILVPDTDLDAPNTELDRTWPGPTKKGALHLEVAALSGTDRFAYEIAPRTARETRAGGKDNGFVDYIGLEISVHSTHRMYGKAVREEIYRQGDLNKSVTAGFWRATGANALRNVAPQGGALGFPGEGNTATGAWTEMDAAEGIAEMQSLEPLAWNPEPFDLADSDYMWESAVFWSQLAFDVGFGLIPVAGDVADVMELAVSLYTGTDKWGQPVTHAQQLMMLGGVMLPFVSSRVLRGLSEVVDPAQTTDYLADLRVPQ